MTNLVPQKTSLLRRYQRLLTRYQTLGVTLSLSDIAETLACTPRYARALLKEMQEEGWLSWVSRPGRGAQGHLQCRVDMTAFQAIAEGDYSLRKAQAPDDTQHATPARQDGFSYIITFYRPLMRITPSRHLPRAERHIVQMVHAGLTRYLSGEPDPVPGLAHTITVSLDGLIWRFILRRGLSWHNGEPIKPVQLLSTLRKRTGGPAMPHVSLVTLEGHTLTMYLSQPDALLGHRLASPVYTLPHPDDNTCGSGPFRITEHTDSSLKLTRFSGWYGETPQAAEITYDTVSRQALDWAVVRLSVPDNNLSPGLTRMAESMDSFAFMTFNENKAGLTKEQQSVVRQLVQSLLKAGSEQQQTILSLPEELTSAADPHVQTTLPPKLHLAYYRTSEMTWLVNRLEKSLNYRGCKLISRVIDVSHWLLPEENWAEQDVCLGYWRIAENTVFSLEERYRHSVMLKVFWPERNWKTGLQLLDRNNSKTYDIYVRQMMRMQRYVIRHSLLTPLWGQRYRLVLPTSVRGVHCYPQCWPDFTRIWTNDTCGPNVSEGGAI